MDNKQTNALLGVVVVILLIAVLSLALRGGECPECRNQTCPTCTTQPPCPSVCPINYSAEGVNVMYLYPVRCSICLKEEPDSCPECSDYYRTPSIIKKIANEFDVSISFYASDFVNDPMILVTRKDNAILGTARTKHNMASTICTLIKEGKVCSIVEQNKKELEECLSHSGISKDTLLYHYSESDLQYSAKMNPYMRELENLTYDYNGTYYKVRWFEENSTDMKILKTCVSDYMDLRFVPQVFCPANMISKNGFMDLSDIRNFADDCMDAAG